LEIVRVAAVGDGRTGHTNLSSGGVTMVFAVAAVRFTEVLLHGLGPWVGTVESETSARPCYPNTHGATCLS
jgi:hypothetical protein